MRHTLEYDQDLQRTLFEQQGVRGFSTELPGLSRPRTLPAEGNAPEGLQTRLAINLEYRTKPWMSPCEFTTHTLYLGDARDLSWIADESVDLVATSPP